MRPISLKIPFALGADEAQEKLTKQLSNNFRNSVADAVNNFPTGNNLDD